MSLWMDSFKHIARLIMDKQSRSCLIVCCVMADSEAMLCRNLEKAQALAAAIGSGVEVVLPDAIISGEVTGDVLINTTSIGMHPLESASPGPRSGLEQYQLVFDAVYTPIETLLLREAAAAGCKTVSGLEMFVGQAAQQYELFNSSQAPVELLRQAVLQSMVSK